jgi:O-6-methylguanine DNA methyltransferase
MEKNNDTFTQAVYKIVREIPVGSVRSYKEVATLAGYPNHARAVGSLMAKNFDPTIPCHRVIHQKGTLGNYNRGGTIKKRAILKNEGYIPH